MRKLLPLVLCGLLICGGCRGTRVSIMGWEPGAPMRADTDGFDELSREDKVGVLVVIGTAVALGVLAAQ
jgi:hypothetical protein